jgi:hypothetical protein
MLFETNKDKTWSLGIAHSTDGFHQISFANSTETYDGGNHVDYVLNQIISQLREFFQKKHKVDVKPSELKNHLSIFINSTVVNPYVGVRYDFDENVGIETRVTQTKDFKTVAGVRGVAKTEIDKGVYLNASVGFDKGKNYTGVAGTIGIKIDF